MEISSFPKEIFPRTPYLLAVSCFAALFVQSPLFAQSVEDAAALDQDTTEPQIMEEVTVSGIRRSLDLAADIKRESNTLVDVITAADIGLFSDNNIGEALARVPGVLLEREAFAAPEDVIARIGQAYSTHLAGGQPDDDALVLVLGRG